MYLCTRSSRGILRITADVGDVEFSLEIHSAASLAKSCAACAQVKHKRDICTYHSNKHPYSILTSTVSGAGGAVQITIGPPAYSSSFMSSRYCFPCDAHKHRNIKRSSRLDNLINVGWAGVSSLWFCFFPEHPVDCRILKECNR